MEELIKKYNFHSINIKKDYIQLRIKLENSFILFFAVEDGLNTEEYLDWFDLLAELEKKFNQYMRVVIFTNKSEEKLIDVLKKDEETDSNQIDYPRAVLCHPHLSERQLYTDLEPFELYKIVEDSCDFYKNQFQKQKEIVFEKIKKILDSFPVVTFIKGSPHDPFCKYSKSFIEILKSTGIKYKSFDIFRDESLRNYLRLYSGWKTYPQFYINSKIVGGLDVLKDLLDKGEFMNLVPIECKKEGMTLWIENYLKENPLVLFTKGNPDNFKCKSSNEAYQILVKNNVKFELFDVLKDEMVRDLVKEVYGYKFYPQLFLNGKLLGGLKFLRDNDSTNTLFNIVLYFLFII